MEHDYAKICASIDSWSAFTPEEQKKISEKVKILMGGGKSQEQAVAEAINIIAPKKSTSHSLYEIQIEGGNYTSKQNPDGTWNIYDLPIFAEDDGKGRMGAIDKKWLLKAIDNMNKNATGKYYAAVHIKHHKTFDPTELPNEGFVMPTRVGLMNIPNRGTVNVLFGDLMNIPAESYELIKAGRLPYRSVEIAEKHYAIPQITSLALMASTAPDMAFPLLTIGKEIKSKEMAMSNYEITYGDNSKGNLMVYDFAGGKIMTPEEEAKKKAEEAEAAKKVGETKEEEPTLKSLYSMLKEIHGHILGKHDAEVKEPAKQTSEGNPVEVVQHELDAVKVKLAEKEKQAEFAKAINDALIAGATYGLTQADVPDMQFALTESGIKGLGIFLNTKKKSFVPDPKRLPDLTDPAITKLATNGVSVEAVAKYSLEYDNLRELGLCRDTTKEDYIAIQESFNSNK
jgi:hypothetical protein